VNEIARGAPVVYDILGKPPAAIESESTSLLLE
jgi:GMP synthase PP-ATPase subunit